MIRLIQDSCVTSMITKHDLFPSELPLSVIAYIGKASKAMDGIRSAQPE